MQQSGAALEAGRRGRVPSEEDSSAKGALSRQPPPTCCPRRSAATIRGPEPQAEAVPGGSGPRLSLRSAGAAREGGGRGTAQPALPPLGGKSGDSPAKCREPSRSFNNISFFSILFLDMGDSAPYIGPVNARSAPAAAGRRPSRKEANEETGGGPCGTVPSFPFSGPLSGPPPPVGHPVRRPLRQWA